VHLHLWLWVHLRLWLWLWLRSWLRLFWLGESAQLEDLACRRLLEINAQVLDLAWFIVQTAHAQRLLLRQHQGSSLQVRTLLLLMLQGAPFVALLASSSSTTRVTPTGGMSEFEFGESDDEGGDGKLASSQSPKRLRSR
jgi:hypothetical protein